MWLYNQRVIYICICLCSDNCFRTDQTRLGYYDVTARLTLMIDLLSLFLKIDMFQQIIYYDSQLGVDDPHLKFDVLNVSKRVVS